MTSGAIAGRFSCTWQTTSRHLRVLEEAGLIHAALRGRERVYELDAVRLRTLTRGGLKRLEDKNPCPERSWFLPRYPVPSSRVMRPDAAQPTAATPASRTACSCASSTTRS